MTRPIVRLAVRGRDLSAALAKSLKYEPAWFAEVAKFRRISGLPHAELIHPDELPSEYAMEIVHRG